MNKKVSKTSSRWIAHQCKGFSLLEVLVAALLLALSIGAMQLLQAKALQYSNSAFYQGIGMQIANGLASSIRANPDGAGLYTRSGDYNPSATISAPSKNCYAETCSASELATYDIYWARQAMRGQLPAGDIFINKVSGENYINVIMVWEGALTDDIGNLPCDGLVATSGAAQNPQCLLMRVRV